MTGKRQSAAEASGRKEVETRKTVSRKEASAGNEAGGRRKEIADETAMKLGVWKPKGGNHSFVRGGKFLLDIVAKWCYNAKAVRAKYRFDYKRWL